MRSGSLTAKKGERHIAKTCLLLAVAMTLSVCIIPIVNSDESDAAVTAETIIPIDQIGPNDTQALAGMIQIDTWEKLTKIGSDETIGGQVYSLSAKYIQMANIESPAGVFFKPIGSYLSPFSGQYDGNGYVITGMRINELVTSTLGNFYAGMFGFASYTTLKNIALKGGSVNVSGGDNPTVGGIVGELGITSTLTNCYNTGTVTHSGGAYAVGGIVGNLNAKQITNCYNAGTVTGTGYVGGIVGTGNGDIVGCYNEGAIGGDDSRAGGIAGLINGGKISICFNAGVIYGEKNAGGIIAALGTGLMGDGGFVTDCFNRGNVKTDQSGWAGGIAGTTSGSRINYIANCYNIGAVTGINADLGGMVGKILSGTQNFCNVYILSSAGLTLYGAQSGTVNTYGGMNDAGYGIAALQTKATYNTDPVGPEGRKYGWGWNDIDAGPWLVDSSTRLPILLLSYAAEKGKITLTPNSKTVNVSPGSEAKFSTTANVSAVSFQWQLLDNGTWGDVPGATSSELIISNATLEMNGNSYRCVASKVGYDTETSGVFALSVTESGGSGSSTMMYVGVAIAVVAVLGVLVYFFVLRRP